MPDNRSTEKKRYTLVPSKSNYQIWVILGLVAIVFGLTFLEGGSNPVEITQKEFRQMVLAHDLRRITVLKNQNIAELTLTSEALNEHSYKEKLKKENNWGIRPEGPHFTYQFLTLDEFSETYKEIQKLDTKATVDTNHPEYRIDENSGITDLVTDFLFLIALVLAFWILVRKIRGRADTIESFATDHFKQESSAQPNFISPPMIAAKCVACGYSREFDDKHIGRRFKCPNCAATVSIEGNKITKSEKN